MRCWFINFKYNDGFNNYLEEIGKNLVYELAFHWEISREVSHALRLASPQNGQLARGLGKKFPPSHPSLVLPSLSAVSSR